MTKAGKDAESAGVLVKKDTADWRMACRHSFREFNPRFRTKIRMQTRVENANISELPPLLRGRTDLAQRQAVKAAPNIFGDERVGYLTKERREWWHRIRSSVCELPEGVESVAYSAATMSEARIDGVVVDERSSERGSGAPKMSITQIAGVVLDERSFERGPATPRVKG
ncbi:hypothetical protein B0H13DRAFT_1855150 [Mycena leptocephala]|nr:hypothetical protein B0H13DRAFT_1855150 [Mycena leptocephala]